jgi:23S rRNA pseudouridine955/2504/2580 synthase
MVAGDWRNARQHIKLPLHKYTTADGERRVSVQAGGLESHTVFTLLKKWHRFALLEAELKTGRTHQIRVHLAHEGHPIVGDPKYGDFAANRAMARGPQRFARMFLHARHLAFDHPASAERVMLDAPLPRECAALLEQL